MKKSILFGALAIFALGAMSIQDVNAQNAEVKAKGKKIETASENQVKPAATTVAQDPVNQKKDDCCADKKACTEKKEGKDCCAEKKVKKAEKTVKAASKEAKTDAKVVKQEGQKVQRNAMVPNAKKGRKHHAKPVKTEK